MRLAVPLLALLLAAAVWAAREPSRLEGSPPAADGPAAGERNLTYPEGAPGPGLPGPPVVMDYGAPQPAYTVPPSTGFDFPVGTGRKHDGFEMNNCFGCDYLYYWGHEGEDFDNGRAGDWVYSASEGVVVWRGLGPGAWGNVMIIQHNVRGATIYTQYAHMRDMLVSVGDPVGRRQIIGTVGMTGTTAPHLHFEVKDRPLIGHGYIGWYFPPSNTVYDPDTGITYFSPSWFINNNRYYWDLWPFTAVPEGRHYYWTWYDNAGGRNWVLMANPEDGAGALTFDVNVRGICPDLTTFGTGPQVSPGQVSRPSFPWLTGGPVVATSTTGGAGVVSQRVIWGSHSIEEVPGIDSSRLSSHYYWPWYDMKTPGFKDWVLVANPGDEDLAVSVSFRNASDGALVEGVYALGPGASVTPQFPGRMGGPVEVKAWVYGRSWDDPAHRRPVIASQRMLLDGNRSFNEMPGIPEGELSDHYFWTWYDESAPGLKDWVLIANPSSTETVTASVSFTDRADGQAVTSVFDVAPGASATPRFPGKMGGPVEVKAWVRGEGRSWEDPADRRPVIATQRSLWGGYSFDEMAGTASTALADEYHWTWYDMQSDGMKNWVLVSNTNAFPIYYEISLAGVDTSAWPGARGTLPAGTNANVVFGGRMGGPVAVRAWTDGGKGTPAAVLASQRVLYTGYFNEVTGTVLP